ncbi:MAG: hypothetical protein ACO25B_10305 [Chitinophagaceae bacterium]
MKLTISIALLALFISCGQADKKPETGTAAPQGEAMTEKPSENPRGNLDYPVLYTEWEIGNPDHINTVLKMYKDWDENAVIEDYALFADTVTIDMPDGKRAQAPKSQMVGKLQNFRSNYKHTENRILSVYPLHNTQTGVDWVSVMVYNKWTYNDNKKDSLLYNDRWRLKDGKIDYLLSLQQTPSRMELKRLEDMTREWKK